jgi:hypothetical protein
MSFFEVSGKTTDNLAEAFEGIFAFISSLKEKNRSCDWNYRIII